MMNESAVVDIQDVSFQYPRTSGPCLEHVSLKLHRGDRVLVIGSNGCGKSTFLSLVGGRRMPKTGSIRVLGHDPFNETAMAQHITLIGAPWPPEAYFANTVDRVASPVPVPERKAKIANALHLRLSRAVDKMSSGEKRRVQILHGLLHPATVFLLDECSTDIDVAERRTVLQLVHEECEARGGCCLYATHILDNVREWATHLLLIEGGRIVSFTSIEDINVPIEEYAFQFMSRHVELTPFSPIASPTTLLQMKECNYYGNTEGSGGSGAGGLAGGDASVPREVVISCNGLTYKNVFSGASFEVYRGERVLLCGCNGAGKSTLLNMLGGKQFFNNTNGALRVLGKVCYDDMTLNGSIAYGGDWWTSVPGGEVHVHEMMNVNTSRGQHLRELLAVDMSWDVRHISSGEQKRVQILFHLLQDKPIVLLDEATADLDVDQRHRLLQFLYEESLHRGVTVVYTTHIFGGLKGWANTLVVLDRTRRGVFAVYRESAGHRIDLDVLTKELIKLKSEETF